MYPDVSEIDFERLSHSPSEEVHEHEDCEYMQDNGILTTGGRQYYGVFCLIRKCLCKNYENTLEKWERYGHFRLKRNGFILIYSSADHVRRTKRGRNRWEFKLITHGKRAMSGHSQSPWYSCINQRKLPRNITKYVLGIFSNKYSKFKPWMCEKISLLQSKWWQINNSTFL